MINVCCFKSLNWWSCVRRHHLTDTEFEPRATWLQSQTGLVFLRQNEQVYRCRPRNHVPHSPKYGHLQSHLCWYKGSHQHKHTLLLTTALPTPTGSLHHYYIHRLSWQHPECQPHTHKCTHRHKPIACPHQAARMHHPVVTTHRPPASLQLTSCLSDTVPQGRMGVELSRQSLKHSESPGGDAP